MTRRPAAAAASRGSSPSIPPPTRRTARARSHPRGTCSTDAMAAASSIGGREAEGASACAGAVVAVEAAAWHVLSGMAGALREADRLVDASLGLGMGTVAAVAATPMAAAGAMAWAAASLEGENVAEVAVWAGRGPCHRAFASLQLPALRRRSSWAAPTLRSYAGCYNAACVARPRLACPLPIPPLP